MIQLKRKLSAALAAAVTVSGIGIIPVNAAVTQLEVGDYVQMGTYSGSAFGADTFNMKWRVIAKDDNGTLLYADKVIDRKIYDAAGTTTDANSSHNRDVDTSSQYSRTKKGSNYWADSNIRSWLNSDEEAGNIKWLCGVAPAMTSSDTYQNTPGFLTNFTDEEKTLIKEVTQKTIISEVDKDVSSSEALKTGDVTGSIWDYNFNDAFANYTYSEGKWTVEGNDTTEWIAQEVTDKVFLLDFEQVLNLKKLSEETFGDTFYIPYAIDGHISYTAYRGAHNYASTHDRYERRAEYIALHNGQSAANAAAYFVSADATISGNYYDGVRPAFYLSDDAKIQSGAGTSESPYIMGTKSVWRITGSELTDSGVKVSVTMGENVTGNEKLLAAAYDINGRNVGASVQAVSADKGSYEFEFSNMSEVNKIKVFMWNGMETMMPLAECVTEKTAPTIHIVSDSTAADWENPDSVAHLVAGVTNYYPQSGWAMMLENYLLDETADVNNKAIPGCTAQAFINLYLPALKTEIKQGDYVIIQFGHNDQKKYSPEEYKGYMKTLADEAVALGASVIFVTSPVRLTFENGELVDKTPWTYPYLSDYAAATKELAQELNMPVVDLNQKSRELVSKLGEEEAKNLYLYLSKDDARFNSDPRFATSYNNKDLKDGTHLLPYGADTYAKFVAEGISELGINLSKYITLDHTPVKP